MLVAAAPITSRTTVPAAPTAAELHSRPPSLAATGDGAADADSATAAEPAVGGSRAGRAPAAGAQMATMVRAHAMTMVRRDMAASGCAGNEDGASMPAAGIGAAYVGWIQGAVRTRASGEGSAMP